MMWRNTIGNEDRADDGWALDSKRKNEDDDVEFRMSGGRTVRVATQRLFVLGMSKYPPIIDVSQMEPSSAVILEQLLTGTARIPMRINMNQAAELCHVATCLKLKNLLKLVEKSLMTQKKNATWQESLDALSVAVHFEMDEAADKIVDDIVFGGVDEEELLMYCKSEKAVERIIERKSALLAEQQEAVPPHEYSDHHPEPSLEMPMVVAHPQPSQMRRLMMNAAKQKIRGMFEKPMNSLKNGFAWISNRRRNAAPRNDVF